MESLVYEALKVIVFVLVVCILVSVVKCLFGS